MHDDMRKFMEALEKHGELVRVKREVDRKHELGAVVRKLCDISGPAVLFEKVKGSDIPVLSNIFGTYHRVALAFDTPEPKLHTAVMALQDKYPVKPKVVSSGPVKEVILTGDKVDLNRLPIPILNAMDGGPYITYGVQIARKEDVGAFNASIHRMQVHSKDTLGLFADPPQHLGWARVAAEEKNKPLEVAVVVGCDPATIMSSVYSAPYNWDELALAGAFLGKPLEVVKCETIDVMVPASAEIVIEGEVLPNVRHEEGYFGEVTGYYDFHKAQRPVFKVKAITHRKNPIFLAAFDGMPVTDDHVLTAFPKAPVLLRDLKGLSPRAVDVYFLPETFGQMAIIKMKKSFTGPAEEEAKRFAFAAFARIYQLKEVIVVDDDIDIYDQASVMWAVATRVRPDLDVITVPRCPSSVLEVAYAKEKRAVSGKLIIDATWKYPEAPPHAEPPRELLDKMDLKDYIPDLKTK